MAPPRRGQSPYVVIKLNRRRCGARIEELVRRTRRSPANIVELLLEGLTGEDMARLAMPFSDVRPEETPR